MHTMRYDAQRKGEFRIFDKKKFEFIDQVWETDPFLQVHMIHAYQDQRKELYKLLSNTVPVNNTLRHCCGH